MPISPVLLALVIFNSLSFSQEAALSKTALPSFTVDSMVFAAKIESRSPIGVNTVFQSTIEKVSCWTKVITLKTPATLKHVWYKNDTKIFELPLTLKSPSGRLWSTKTVSGGNWKVEVVDEGGKVLKSGTFVVK